MVDIFKTSFFYFFPADGTHNTVLVSPDVTIRESLSNMLAKRGIAIDEVRMI